MEIAADILHEAADLECGIVVDGARRDAGDIAVADDELFERLESVIESDGGVSRDLRGLVRDLKGVCLIGLIGCGDFAERTFNRLAAASRAGEILGVC